MPLLHPLDRDALDASGQAAWDKIANFGPIAPKVRLLAHHPQILEAYWDLGIAANTELDLSPATVHLIVLRTSVLDRCAYGWRQRVPKALAAGLERVKIDALADWEQSDVYTDDERLLLAYVDIVLGGRELPAETEAALKATYRPATIIGVTILALYYEMSHALMELLEIVPESSAEALPWEVYR